MKRSLRHTDFSPLGELFKARLGEVVTIPASEPANLNEDARLFDTYQKASQVVRAAVEPHFRGKLPKASTELSTLSLRDRLDGWGNAFCLVEANGRVAAISTGPRPVERASCSDLPIDLRQLNNLPSGKLYRYASGVLVFLSETR